VAEGGFEVLSDGGISQVEVSEAVGLDQISYEVGEYRGSMEVCMEWLRRCPNMYTMLRDRATGGIVAYCGMVPVASECYGRLRSGTLLDLDIPGDSVLDLDRAPRGLYRVYLLSVVVHPEYRGRGFAKAVLKAAFGRLAAGRAGGVFVGGMLAEAVSAEGEGLCRGLGMECVGATVRGTELYEVEWPGGFVMERDFSLDKGRGNGIIQTSATKKKDGEQ